MEFVVLHYLSLDWNTPSFAGAAAFSWTFGRCLLVRASDACRSCSLQHLPLHGSRIGFQASESFEALRRGHSQEARDPAKLSRVDGKELMIP